MSLLHVWSHTLTLNLLMEGKENRVRSPWSCLWQSDPSNSLLMSLRLFFFFLGGGGGWVTWTMRHKRRRGTMKVCHKKTERATQYAVKRWQASGSLTGTVSAPGPDEQLHARTPPPPPPPPHPRSPLPAFPPVTNKYIDTKRCTHPQERRGKCKRWRAASSWRGSSPPSTCFRVFVAVGSSRGAARCCRFTFLHPPPPPHAPPLLFSPPLPPFLSLAHRPAVSAWRHPDGGRAPPAGWLRSVGGALFWGWGRAHGYVRRPGTGTSRMFSSNDVNSMDDTLTSSSWASSRLARGIDWWAGWNRKIVLTGMWSHSQLWLTFWPMTCSLRQGITLHCARIRHVLAGQGVYKTIRMQSVLCDRPVLWPKVNWDSVQVTHNREEVKLSRKLMDACKYKYLRRAEYLIDHVLLIESKRILSIIFHYCDMDKWMQPHQVSWCPTLHIFSHENKSA